MISIKHESLYQLHNKGTSTIPENYHGSVSSGKTLSVCHTSFRSPEWLYFLLFWPFSTFVPTQTQQGQIRAKCAAPIRSILSCLTCSDLACGDVFHLSGRRKQKYLSLSLNLYLPRPDRIQRCTGSRSLLITAQLHMSANRFPFSFCSSLVLIHTNNHQLM